MKDERRQCANCNHEHAWGILRYSMDNTPLYGARKCWCHCDNFVVPVEGMENLPAMTKDETKALWEQTEFLNPQVPMAVRITVRQIMSQAKSAHGANALTKMLPEFMGLMISQITDIRGALVRDETKFAHLVAHTDEIVESMRGVMQLNERLMTLSRLMNDTAERLDKLEPAINRIAEAVGALEPTSSVVDDIAALESGMAKVSPSEARHAFLEATRSLFSEPIVVDSEELCANCQHEKDYHTDGHIWCRHQESIPPCECSEFVKVGSADVSEK